MRVTKYWNRGWRSCWISIRPQLDKGWSNHSQAGPALGRGSVPQPELFQVPVTTHPSDAGISFPGALSPLRKAFSLVHAALQLLRVSCRSFLWGKRGSPSFYHVSPYPQWETCGARGGYQLCRGPGCVCTTPKRLRAVCARSPGKVFLRNTVSACLSRILHGSPQLGCSTHAFSWIPVPPMELSSPPAPWRFVVPQKESLS